MLFHIFANAPITQQFNGAYVIAFAVVAVAVHLGDLAVARWVSASATAPVVFNAVPVLADIDPRTFCLSAETISEKTTPRTKAILVDPPTWGRSWNSHQGAIWW